MTRPRAAASRAGLHDQGPRQAPPASAGSRAPALRGAARVRAWPSSFSDDLGSIVLRFHQPQLEQARRLQVRLEPVEGGKGDVFRGRYDAVQELNIAIEVPVIDQVDQLATEYAIDVPEVDDH